MASVRKDHNLWLSVVEAKNLDIDDRCSTYCLVKINNQERGRTKTVKKNQAPLYNDDYYFNLSDNFKELQLVVWNELKRGDKPLGQLLIPRDFLATDHNQHEEWFTVQPALHEGSVTGSVEIDIAYTRARGDEPDRLSFTVKSAKDLMSKDNNGLSDPYFVMHLIPDEDVTTTFKSKVKKETLSPMFMETHNYTLPKNRDGTVKHRALLFTIWDWDRFSEDDFLGQVIIDLEEIRSKIMGEQVFRSSEAYTLLAKTLIDPMAPAPVPKDHVFAIHSYKSPTWCYICSGLLYGIVKQGLKCKDCGFNSHEKCEKQAPSNCRGDKVKKIKRLSTGLLTHKISKAQAYTLEVQDDLIKAMSLGAQAPGHAKPHVFETRFFKQPTNCGHCYSAIWMVEGAQCKICGLNCHEKCKDSIPPLCGTVGQVRLKYKYTDDPVLSKEVYLPLFELLGAQDFYLIMLLQSATNQKEDTARTLVKCFEAQGTSIDFLNALARKEITSTTDPNTIFRGNSLATKAFDAYLKMHGMPYLHSLLKPIVSAIIHENLNCEVDETRFDKKDDINKNWKNLKAYVQRTIDAIFASPGSCPFEFRVIFANVRELVIKQFPTDPVIQWTAISGFIFLRFICPAILGPQLFDIMDEMAKPKTARTLTLIAKTIQNLANLVEFGGKEPYMVRMNELISKHKEDMKQFLEKISTAVPLTPTPNPKIDLEMELARLYRYFLQSKEKMDVAHKETAQPINKKIVERIPSWDPRSKDAKQTENHVLYKKFDEVLSTLKTVHKKAIDDMGSASPAPVSARSRVSQLGNSANDVVQETTESLLRTARQCLASISNAEDQDEVLDALKPLIVISHQLLLVADLSCTDKTSPTGIKVNALIESFSAQVSKVTTTVKTHAIGYPPDFDVQNVLEQVTPCIKELAVSASGIFSVIQSIHQQQEQDS